MSTCYELYNATMALGEKSFSLYLKNRNFKSIATKNNWYTREYFKKIINQTKNI